MRPSLAGTEAAEGTVPAANPSAREWTLRRDRDPIRGLMRLSRPKTPWLALAAIFPLMLAACSEAGEGAESPVSPQQKAFADWLEGRKILRRGGNGKIDSEVLAVARTRLPLDGHSGWSAAEHLVVWARFENLDPHWKWRPKQQPVWLRVATRSGTSLKLVDDATDPDAASRRLLGAQTPDDVIEAGERFVSVSIFELPPAKTQDLVIHTVTRLPTGTDFDLVAVLVPAAEVARPGLDAR